MDARLIINTDEFGQDPLIGMDFAAAHGIHELELRTAYGRNALDLTNAEITNLGRAANERDLRYAGFASPLFKWWRGSARSDVAVDSFGFPTVVSESVAIASVARAIEVASRLGIEFVRVFSYLNEERAERGHEVILDDKPFALALSRASAAGIRLLLENEPVCNVVGCAEITATLKAYAPLGLGLWLDIANWHRVSPIAAPTDIAGIVPHIGYVHLKDYRRAGSDVAFCAVGDGDVPYRTLLPFIIAQRPHIPLAIESHVREEVPRAIESSISFARATISGKH